MNGTAGMPEVLLDTDVLVDHLQGARRIAPDFAGSAYSSISRAELYSEPTPMRASLTGYWISSTSYQSIVRWPKRLEGFADPRNSDCLTR